MRVLIDISGEMTCLINKNVSPFLAFVLLTDREVNIRELYKLQSESGEETGGRLCNKGDIEKSE